MGALDQFYTTAAAGALPPPVMEALCGAHLFPLRKKDAGVRPVAVADRLRRLVEKTLLQLPATKAAMASCLPTQTGFAGKGAVEQVALTFQAAVIGRTPDTYCN